MTMIETVMKLWIKINRVELYTNLPEVLQPIIESLCNDLRMRRGRLYSEEISGALIDNEMSIYQPSGKKKMLPVMKCLVDTNAATNAKGESIWKISDSDKIKLLADYRDDPATFDYLLYYGDSDADSGKRKKRTLLDSLTATSAAAGLDYLKRIRNRKENLFALVASHLDPAVLENVDPVFYESLWHFYSEIEDIEKVIEFWNLLDKYGYQLHTRVENKDFTNSPLLKEIYNGGSHGLDTNDLLGKIKTWHPRHSEYSGPAMVILLSQPYFATPEGQANILENIIAQNKVLLSIPPGVSKNLDKFLLSRDLSQLVVPPTK